MYNSLNKGSLYKKKQWREGLRTNRFCYVIICAIFSGFDLFNIYSIHFISICLRNQWLVIYYNSFIICVRKMTFILSILIYMINDKSYIFLFIMYRFHLLIRWSLANNESHFVSEFISLE